MSTSEFSFLMPKKGHVLTEEAVALIARRFAVLAEPMRLKLLHLLMAGEMNVNALVDASGGTQANVSRHLQTLAEAGILARRKEGVQAFYSVADPSIFDLCDLVCTSIESQMAKRSPLFKPAARDSGSAAR